MFVHDLNYLILDEYTDNDVCLKLHESFENVAKGFIEDLINDPLMEKMNLEEQMPEVIFLYWH